MNKLTVAAAALAAGMISFAASAQEAPQPPSTNPVGLKDVTEPVIPAQALSFGPEAHRAAAAAKVEEAGIDTTKTAAIAPRVTLEGKAKSRPEVKAKARKKIDIKAGDAAASTGGRAAHGGSYHSIISRYAAEYGVPVSLAHAVIRVESNYRPNARGRAGEVGLMQIKPSTARGLGYSGSLKGLYNPETNIRWGMKYLGMAHKLGGGSTCGTILKYNAGHAARRMNPVSAAYCKKVKRHLGA